MKILTPVVFVSEILCPANFFLLSNGLRENDQSALIDNELTP